MADLSDDKLTTIIATVTGDQSDLSGDARFEAMRAAIAADRTLNVAPSVGAEGLPPLPRGEEAINFTFGCIVYTADQMRAYALAALASRPAVDADKAQRTLLEQYDLDQSPEYRKGYEDGRLKGYEAGYRHGLDAARHPAQREGE